MPLLVLSRRFSDDANTVWRAAVSAGWDVVRATSYVPPPDLVGRTDAKFYAETLLADAIAPALELVLLQPDAAWLAELPLRYLQRAVRVSTVAGVRRRSERAFVKPADEKVFPARVYEPAEAIDPDGALDDRLPTLVSEPVRFGIEVRAFVLDRQVVTHSAYVRDGDIAKTDDGSWPLTREEEAGALRLLNELCGDETVALPPGVVLDVGHIEGRGWAVVEANAAWASGVCGCDAAEVLRVVRRTTLPAASVTEADRRWVRVPSLYME
jgi:hypothetical protein